MEGLLRLRNNLSPVFYRGLRHYALTLFLMLISIYVLDQIIHNKRKTADAATGEQEQGFAVERTNKKPSVTRILLSVIARGGALPQEKPCSHSNARSAAFISGFSVV